MMTCQQIKDGLKAALPVLLVIWLTIVIVSVPAMAASNGRSQSMIEQLVGRWMRTDGGYVIEIKGIGKDGTLNVAYFNPRPINVAHAKLNSQNGHLRVFIELRDVNYPGSTYDLMYDPETDHLFGIYFQAVERVTYDIEFVRSR